jgi:hypothetical protein
LAQGQLALDLVQGLGKVGQGCIHVRHVGQPQGLGPGAQGTSVQQALVNAQQRAVLVAGACGLHLHPARFHFISVKHGPLLRLVFVVFIKFHSLACFHFSSSFCLSMQQGARQFWLVFSVKCAAVVLCLKPKVRLVSAHGFNGLAQHRTEGCQGADNIRAACGPCATP